MLQRLKVTGGIITTILFAISVAISVMVITWIHKLEETACKCSEDFKRDYIKYYLYVYVSIYTFMYLNAMYMLLTSKVLFVNGIVMVLTSILQTILPIFALLNIIFSLMYIWRLKEINCKCSEDIRREIYYVLNWINVGFIGLAVIMIIFIAIVAGSVMASLK